MIASFVTFVFAAIGYATSSIVARLLEKNLQHVSKSGTLLTTVVSFVLVFYGFSCAG